jgi:hypothetical protein
MENRENLDEDDEAIILLLGYAVARAQLFEHAMVRMLEAKSMTSTSRSTSAGLRSGTGSRGVLARRPGSSGCRSRSGRTSPPW